MKACENNWMETSDRNSRTGNEKREIRAGSKISRPEREKAGNGKNIYALKRPYSQLKMFYFVLPPHCEDLNIPLTKDPNVDQQN